MMRNVELNELSRAVSVLNFEKENMGIAGMVLEKKYKIPSPIIPLLLRQIFFRLGSSNANPKISSSNSLWDLFHKLAHEEVISLKVNYSS